MEKQVSDLDEFTEKARSTFQKKRLRILPIIAISVSLGFGFQHSRDWILVEFYKFKIEFPVGPKYKIEQLTNATSEMTLRTFKYDASNDPKDENLDYILRCYEYPDNLLNSDSIEKVKRFLDDFVKSRVTITKGRLLKDTAITNKSFPGREYKIRFAQGDLFTKERVFVAKNTLYHVDVIGETKRDFGPSTDRFLSSFKILE